jgi:hypothetical protein
VRCLAVVAGVLTVTLGGCGGNATNGEGDASCAAIVLYEGRTYVGSGVRVAPREGKRIGTGVLPGCDDGGGRTLDEEIELAEIEGVSPEIAVAWHGDPSGVYISKSVDRLPRELRRLMRAPNCDPRDEPIDLAGPWLGIVEVEGGAELDTTREAPLTPPYDLEIFVEETTRSPYERAFLTVRVPEQLGHPLTPSDVRSSLWEGGTIDLTVACREGGYVAERVSTHPPES